MSAIEFKAKTIAEWKIKLRNLLQERNNLTREDLEYLVSSIHGLRDARLKKSIACLVGWGDDERSELDTFIAISLQLMTETTPSRLRSAVEAVELKMRLQHAFNNTRPPVV